MVKFPKLRILGGIAVPKVLLADDSTHAQRMGTKILTGEGFEVVTVSNGEAAVKKLTGGGFDLVLADVFMPGRTGYELCAFVKTDPKTSHLPVILVVGQLEPYDPAQGERVQADGVLTKPFEASKVLEMVKGALKAAEKKKKAAAPPPPPPPPPEEAALPEMELAAIHPTPVEVPEDLARAAFGMFAEEAAPPEPPVVEAFEVAPAPEAAAPFAFEEAAPAAAEFAFPAEPAVEAPAVPEAQAEELEVELTPEPAEAAEPTVVAEVETEEAAPAGFELTTEAPSTEFELPVEPAATAELIFEEPPRAAEEAPAAPPALHWVAEPAEVTEADRALFGPPAAMAGAAAAAPAAAPAPEGAPDWADLLKHVEEPVKPAAAAAPAPAAEPPVEAPPEAVAEAAAETPAEPAPEVQAAPIPEEAIAVEQPPVAGEPEAEAVEVEAAAPPVEPAPEAIPAQEPVPAETAAPPQARVVLDPEMVRAAVEGGFDKAGMTALKAVPGLVDAIASEILQRMN